GNLFPAALQNVATGLRHSRPRDVNDSCLRNAHDVAPVHENIERAVPGFNQVLDVDGNCLRVSWNIIRRSGRGRLLRRQVIGTRDNHYASRCVGYSSGGRQNFQQCCRPDDLIHHRVSYSTHDRNRLAVLLLHKNGYLRVRHQAVLEQQLLEIGFQLKWSVAGGGNPARDQWVADFARLAHAHVARQFCNVEYLAIQQVSRSDGSVHRVGPREVRQLLDFFVRLLRSFEFLLAVGGLRSQVETEQYENRVPRQPVRDPADCDSHSTDNPVNTMAQAARRCQSPASMRHSNQKRNR